MIITKHQQYPSTKTPSIITGSKLYSFTKNGFVRAKLCFFSRQQTSVV